MIESNAAFDLTTPDCRHTHVESWNAGISAAAVCGINVAAMSRLFRITETIRGEKVEQNDTSSRVGRREAVRGKPTPINHPKQQSWSLMTRRRCEGKHPECCSSFLTVASRCATTT